MFCFNYFLSFRLSFPSAQCNFTMPMFMSIIFSFRVLKSYFCTLSTIVPAIVICDGLRIKRKKKTEKPFYWTKIYST